MAFFDMKQAKTIIDEEVDAFLGGKNEEELKEEKLRKEMEDLKTKQKKDKKNFSKDDEAKLKQIKQDLKKYDEAAKKLKDTLAKESAPEEEETENDKLSKLMARDMKSSLNPPELLKKHLD